MVPLGSWNVSPVEGVGEKEGSRQTYKLRENVLQLTELCRGGGGGRAATDVQTGYHSRRGHCKGLPRNQEQGVAFEERLKSSGVQDYLDMQKSEGGAGQGKQAWEGILEVATGSKEMQKQRTQGDTAGSSA